MVQVVARIPRLGLLVYAAVHVGVAALLAYGKDACWALSIGGACVAFGSRAVLP